MNPPVFAYGPHILWEAPIQTLASVVLRPAQTVLDIGSNTGGLAIAFSRIVGPKGTVLGFECNPRMAEWARANAKVNAARNVHILQDACFDQAGLNLEFFADASRFGVGGSLVYKEGEGQLISVRTTTVDDECRSRRLSPRLIKIDVEGVEAQVIDGARKTIEKHQPILVFERQNGLNSKNDPLKSMLALDYKVYDVNTLAEVDERWAGWKFPANLIALPAKLSGPWVRLNERLAVLNDDQVSAQLECNKPGLFSVAVEINCHGSSDGEIEFIDPSGARIAYYNAPAAHITDPTCSHFPVMLAAAGNCSVRVTGPMTLRGVRYCEIEIPKALG